MTVAAGIFATFLGIALGLANFDAANIQATSDLVRTVESSGRRVLAFPLDGRKTTSAA